MAELLDVSHYCTVQYMKKMTRKNLNSSQSFYECGWLLGTTAGPKKTTASLFKSLRMC